MIKELEHFSHEENLRAVGAQPGKINVQKDLTNVYKYLGLCVRKMHQGSSLSPSLS